MHKQNYERHKRLLKKFHDDYKILNELYEEAKPDQREHWYQKMWDAFFVYSEELSKDATLYAKAQTEETLKDLKERVFQLEVAVHTSPKTETHLV
ncbi:hypothetical protein GF360_00010 [candidate division WWE3 bacterium]|nr:hypothetical protein [candidate division WWE3 bacterium]